MTRATALLRARFGHEILLFAFLVMLAAAAAGLDPTFLSPSVQVPLLSHVFEPLLLALSMTLVIVSRGIDLSVGSTMALSAVILGLLFERGAGIGLAVLAALGTGAVAGLVNGVLVALRKIHPLIVTLATLAAFRGIAEGLSLGRPVSGFPDGFTGLFRAGVSSPAPLLLVAFAFAAAAVVLHRTTFGRRLVAIGMNERASAIAGIGVKKTKLALYTLSGLVSGLAAVLFVARRNTAKADIGLGMELDVITAVVLGGTRLEGGRASITGTLAGVLLIHETREFAAWHFANDAALGVAIGVLLIVSVLFSSILSRREG